MGRACCVPDCKSGINVPSHKFPKNRIRCLEWVKSLKLYNLENKNSDIIQKHKVCYKHFHSTDYSCSPSHRFLKTTAVPTLIEPESALHVQELHNEINVDESMLVDKVLDLEKQVQQHNKQLLEHQSLHMKYNEQQTELPQQLHNTQQEALHINIQTIEEQSQLQQAQEKIHVIQDHENRLKQLEEKMENLITSHSSLKRIRPDLQQMIRKADLTPRARRLYNTVVKLKRDKRRLQHVMKGLKKKKKTKNNIFGT